MPKQYFAFISYASQVASWVEHLHGDLERCLEQRRPGMNNQIFLDRKDLRSGSSWVDQLEQGIETAEHLIFVATPEALVSPWVGKERSAFLAANRARRLHVVRLTECRLPAFLADIQYVDFSDSNQAKYEVGLDRLLRGLLTLDGRQPLDLPKDLSAPAASASSLPEALRCEFVDGLCPLMEKRHWRTAIGAELGIPLHALKDGSTREVAERILPLATGDDDPLTAAIRVAEVLIGAYGEELATHAQLTQLLRTLIAHHDQTSDSDDTAPGLLGEWLRKVVRDHESLVPYFQQKTELALLDRVFVEVQLRRAVDVTALDPSAMDRALRRHEPMKIQELLEWGASPTAGTEDSGRWVILGDPGAGKTTLLRHLAADLARQDSPRWIPVFESMPRLMREREWFLDRIERLKSQSGPAQGLANVLERAAQEGKLLLLLDGLDEVPREARDDADSLLRQLADKWPRSPIVVTSRPIGFRPPSRVFQEVRLLPFDRARRHEFLARWLGRDEDRLDTAKADDAAVLLESDRSLTELASNPLYLTLMALLIEQGTSPAANRAQLYDQVFHLLLDGKHRPVPRPMECQDAVRDALRYLAFEMTRDNRDSEAVTAIEARLYQPEADAVRETLERVPRWRQGLRPFLTDLAEHAGILGPHDGPDTDWRFWHRTFREALASEALAKRYRRGGQAAVLEHAGSIAGDESRWAEAYALLTGQVDNPDALVKALVKKQSALGLRALATAQSLAPETLQEILQLSEDPDERAEVFLRLPELVGDGERTLALIDRLRRETRNGNDLYHLDLACELVARVHPEQATAAKVQQERLYDHIPSPPKGLFEQVKTKDGVVDLWCRIPEGTYRLGSPKEELAWDGERLPYNATLEAPLCMAAVPVTQAQYRAFDPAHTSHFQGNQRPVESVSWYAAMAFCRWLARHAATSGARLPSEEEWEIACRAGTSTQYWSGNTEEDLNRVGWYDKNSEGQTRAVGEKEKNPWGLYDVHGNVWEWTKSPWADPQAGQQEDVVIPSETPEGHRLLPTAAPLADASADLAEARRARRVIRGGGCWNSADRARSAYRGRFVPGDRFGDLGFRVLLPSSGSAPAAPPRPSSIVDL